MISGETLAERLTFRQAHFTGSAVAECGGCGRVWVLWDDIDDLEHDCRED